jgi:hypothetical protein
MMSRLFALATLALVVGCTDAQVAAVQVDVGKVQAALNSACADVAQAEAMANAFGVALIPQAAVIEGFISGSCVAGQATAELVGNAVNDPATVTWTQNLAVALRNTLKRMS